VLLDKHSFLAKNQKLAPKWSGPHKILRLKGECNVELLLRHNNKKLITHVNRLKLYFVPKSAAVSSPTFSLHKNLPHPLHQHKKLTRWKIFYMTMATLKERSPIQTLTLQTKSCPLLLADAVRLPHLPRCMMSTPDQLTFPSPRLHLCKLSRINNVFGHHHLLHQHLCGHPPGQHRWAHSFSLSLVDA
jgi:hypothetical protein